MPLPTWPTPSTLPTRKIIHVDMDAFYASVEQHDHPKYRGKPIIVGGSPKSRGVVCAASYEARKFGVRSAMPCAQAARLCPQGIFVPPRFERYVEISRQVHDIFWDYSGQVESLGLDEAYVDVTENLRRLPSATATANEIRARIFETTGLTASAGVAANKMLAKIASDLKKPNGLTVITPTRAAVVLRDLPVRKLPGVGPVTEEKLIKMGYATAGALAQASEAELHGALGKMGGWLYRVSQGRDDREVSSERERKSVGSEDTFSVDLLDLQDMHAVLARLARQVADRLVAKDLLARTVTLKVKYDDFTQNTRSQTLLHPAADAELFRETACQLLQATEAGRRPIRLLGIGLSQLGAPGEPPIRRTPIQMEFAFV
ncbi:MAG: DNA polymerase IV [Bacteriovoracia bacterium]